MVGVYMGPGGSPGEAEREGLLLTDEGVSGWPPEVARDRDLRSAP